MTFHISRAHLALLAVSAIGLGAGLASFTRTQAAPTVVAPAAVAVVNVRQAMDAIKESAFLQDFLSGKRKDALKGLEEKQKAIESLKESLKIMAPGSAAALEKQEQIVELSVNLEGDQKVQEDKYGRLVNASRLNLYRKVCARAGKLAEEKGYDLLLDQTITQDTLNKIPTSARAAEHFLNGDRELLWAKKSTDLTDDLVAAMNNEFNQRGAAPAPALGPVGPSPLLGPTVPAPAPAK